MLVLGLGSWDSLVYEPHCSWLIFLYLYFFYWSKYKIRITHVRLDSTNLKDVEHKLINIWKALNKNFKINQHVNGKKEPWIFLTSKESFTFILRIKTLCSALYIYSNDITLFWKIWNLCMFELYMFDLQWWIYNCRGKEILEP